MEKANTDDIVLADLRLPDGESTTLLDWMRKSGMEQPFIVMTDYAEVHTAVSAMKLGSVDYIPKKLLEDKLLTTINGIVQKQMYNPQIEMFAHFKTKSSFHKTKRII